MLGLKNSFTNPIQPINTPIFSHRVLNNFLIKKNRKKKGEEQEETTLLSA